MWESSFLSHSPNWSFPEAPSEGRPKDQAIGSADTPDLELPRYSLLGQTESSLLRTGESHVSQCLHANTGCDGTPQKASSIGRTWLRSLYSAVPGAAGT